ncbi:coiled-coil domain-containing protein 107 [Pogona vitticeps]
MVLSSMQQVVISVALVLCLFVVMPRMFGGGGRASRGGAKTPPGRHDPHQHRHGRPDRLLQSQMNSGNSEKKTYENIQQMRNAMEKELKTERTRGNGRDFALTLMPLYAIGVGVFALYKFLKMKSQEERVLTKEKNTEDKTKETERQLLELEQHLAQTEKMLNSLLTQLDPLSSCINTLASEQRDEIMIQLESIRKLMRESGLDKSAMKPQDITHVCQEKLEDLIQSFSEPSEAELNEEAHEKCGDEVPFDDAEEHYDEEEYKYCQHDFLFGSVGNPVKMEVAEISNQDTAELETGLRRRVRNE